MLIELISDPVAAVQFIAMMLPGVLIGLSFHEWAHAWVADRCGDPTARAYERLTLHPAAHIDPVGLVMMLAVGFGWARPVPVNALNLRHRRRDMLMVSLAGVTANLLLFIVGIAVIYAITALGIHRATLNSAGDAYYLTEYMGDRVLMFEEWYYELDELVKYAPYESLYFIEPVFGTVMRYVYEVLMYFSMLNLGMVLLNLLPVPPLDGFRVLGIMLFPNLRIRLSRRVQWGITIAMAALLLSGVMTDALIWLQDGAFEFVGDIAVRIFESAGLI